MRRLSGLLLVIGTLTGCAGGPSGSPWLIERISSSPSTCAPLTHDQELAINLSQEMFEGGRLHAALANLERLPGDLPEARLRKARILRLLGRSEAQGLYRGLLGSCLTAEAHHGLGQLAASARRYDEALEHLRGAVSLVPTDDAMRNDLGVVYLNLRQLPEAHFELVTALELNERDNRAAENLLTLLLYQNRWPQASELVSRRKLTPAQFREAEQRALRLREEDAPGAAKGPTTVAPVKPATAMAPAPVAVPSRAVANAEAPRPSVVRVAPPSSAALPPARSGVHQVQSAPVRQVVPITGIE